MATVEQVLALLTAEEVALATVAGEFLLVMRDPQPSEVQVPLDAEVYLRLVSLAGDPSVAGEGVAQLTITIDGTLVYDLTGGGFVAAGWAGPSNAAAAHALADPYCFQEVRLDQTGAAVWTTEQVITVDVAGQDHLANAFSETYTFTCLDVTAPRLLSAESRDERTVRLTFSEAMAVTPREGWADTETAGSGPWNLAAGGETLTVEINGTAQTVTFDTAMWLVPAAATADEVASALSALLDGASAIVNASGNVEIRTDAVGDTVTVQVTGGTANAVLAFPLTPVKYGSSVEILAAENFTITAQNVFPDSACAVSVVGAAAVTGSGNTEVDLTADTELTFGQPYLVTVNDDVEDAHSVAIDASYRTATFTAWSPDWPRRRDNSLDLPQDLWTQDTTQEAAAVVGCLQEVADWMMWAADHYLDSVDPDMATDDEIERHLYDLGNPFDWADLDLTAAQRRKLALLLPDLYALRGTNTGIEAAIRLLLELEVQVSGHADDCWLLGEGLLGDYYPAQVLCANTETYNLSAAPTTLWVAVDGGRDVAALNQAAQTFTVDGLRASEFAAGRVFQIVESTGNDGSYTVAPAGPTESGGQTVIPVTGAIPVSTADGRIVDLITFSNVAGTDFAAPAAATATEVATAVAADILGGGAAAVDPGAGAVVAIISTSPSGTIQVLGGTANAVLGFNTSVHSSSGTSALGPTDERALRTFDVVTSTAVSSTQAELIERIAVRFKPVNTHFGRVRTAYVVADDGIWRLGRSLLGADTALG